MTPIRTISVNRPLDIENSPLEKLAIDGGTPCRTEPFGPRWVFTEEDAAELKSVMDRAHGAWRTGHKVREFIQNFQSAFSVKNGVATGCGTSAVHAAVSAIDAEPGDEVITTSATDVGSLIGILQQNLIPVFVDWSPDSFNMDPHDIERKITDRTRAILVVHLFGFPCDMDAVMDIATRHGIPVIEDCAQAHLAEHKGRKVGTFGDLAAFSFGLKTLSLDQGGMVTTDNPDLAAKVRGFTAKGSTRQGDTWVPYHRLGSYSPMTDLQAAIGVAQLRRLEDATRRREMMAGHLNEIFSQINHISLPQTQSGDRNVYYVYPYCFDQKASGIDASHFIKALKAEGVADSFGPYLHGSALHHRPVFRDANTYGHSGFPIRDLSGALRVDYRHVSLPNIEQKLPGMGYFHMRNSFTSQDARSIVDCIHKVARGLGLLSKPFHVKIPDSLPDIMAENPPPIPNLKALDNAEIAATPTEGLTNHVARNVEDLRAILDGLGDRGARIYVSQGDYVFTKPLTLVQRRNLHFIGEGGNPGKPGTKFIFTGDGEGLDLLTSMHCRFEAIAFSTRGDRPGHVISLRADDTGAQGTSTNAVTFSHCSFRAPKQTQGLLIKDSANISFTQCWFLGVDKIVNLGVPTSSESRSVSNGLANSISFRHCHVFGIIAGQRAACVLFEDTMFACANGYADGRIDFHGDDSEVTNVTIRNCFALEARKGIFFRQGENGAGLIFENNRISGFDEAAHIDGLGGAVFRCNVLRSTKNGAAKKPPEIFLAEWAQNCITEGNTVTE